MIRIAGEVRRHLVGAVVGLLALCPVASFVGTAHAVTLTFDGSICEPGGNSSCLPGIDIGATYGSIPGQLDVSFASREGPQNGAVDNEHLRFWDAEYGNLTNVAYAAMPLGGATQVGEIALTPRPGFQVTLNGFDLAGWRGDRSSQYTIYDSAFNVLATSGGAIDISGSTHNHFAFAITRADAVIIQWGPDSFNVGIDNLDFTVSAVPEPSAFILLAVGLGLIGMRLHARRRR